MKIIFYFGILSVIIFEITKIYLFRYIPEETGMKSVDLAYFIHYWRWDFRLFFWLFVFWGLLKIYEPENRKQIYLSLLSAASITYLTNFILLPNLKTNPTEDIEFEASPSQNVHSESKIIGVFVDGVAKAYPVQFIGNHHQIIDSIGNKRAMITYCKICKHGRVFEPVTNGRPNQFGLLGTDFCNAMFEDLETGSWWRQSDGMALAGKMKGTLMSELPFEYVSLEKWVSSHPQTTIMQATPDQSSVAQIANNSNSNFQKSDAFSTDNKSFAEYKSKNNGMTKMVSIVK